MKLEDISPGLLAQAIGAYLRIAWPGGYPPRLRVPDFSLVPHETVVEQIRETFRDESHSHGKVRVQRFALRLGNERYPNMKLVLQEFMEQGQFFFAVDSHDQLPVAPGSPGFEEWQRLRDFNAWLKHRIEARWRYLGVPTLARVMQMIASGNVQEGAGPRRRILVVDDDEDIGTATAEVLRRSGYVVDRARDGREALDRICHARPDLIVMDYMMPRINGAEVCRQIKQDDTWKKIPVLLATTTPLEMIGDHSADGFMVKPFHRQILLEMIRHLLRHREKSGSGVVARKAE